MKWTFHKSRKSHRKTHHKASRYKKTYRSFIYISLMTWCIAVSFFIYGYFLVDVAQIPSYTLNEIYKIGLEAGLTIGLLNGILPVGGLVGALLSSFIIVRFSRR
jgi:hypothetical protein